MVRARRPVREAAAVPARQVIAAAPTRVLDIGGWTDTWFAGHGKVFHVAVGLRVEVRVTVTDRHPDGPPVVIDAVDLGDRYGFDPADGPRGPHPLLEAAICEAGLGDGLGLEVRVRSEAPAGASMGTSASVLVALVAALDAAVGVAGQPRRRTPYEIAREAHRIETEVVGWQSGIQDQLAAAHGGINLIDISAYPDATVTRLAPPPEFVGALGSRLVVVYLGEPHRSSAVHEAVIASLSDDGGTAVLDELRRAAVRARDAVMAGDFAGLGAAMAANTDAQRALHPELINADAERLIEIAARHGAAGVKINGAGGSGGSVTILAGEGADAQAALRADIGATLPRSSVLPVSLADDGVVVRVLRSDSS